MTKPLFSRSIPFVSTVIAAGLALLGFAVPAPAADAAHGEKLAKRWCAACHIVANDQTRGTDNVPTFDAIANTPGIDAKQIAGFLRDPHPKMPDMQLSTIESADLAAYIMSFKK